MLDNLNMHPSTTAVYHLKHCSCMLCARPHKYQFRWRAKINLVVKHSLLSSLCRCRRPANLLVYLTGVPVARGSKERQSSQRFI